MDHLTSAGAGAALTSPLWIQTLTPYAQFVTLVMGGLWIAVQCYYKIKNEWRKHSARSDET